MLLLIQNSFCDLHITNKDIVLTKQIYPDHIRQLMEEVQRLMQDDTADYKEPLIICFEILAMYPQHQEASQLVMDIYSEPRLIYETRQAVCQHIEEWDDRPFQFRLRLAHSFRRLHCWLDEQLLESDVSLSPDIIQIVQNANRLMTHHQSETASSDEDLAWYLYRQAIEHTERPDLLLLYAGNQYAAHGFFAESASLLNELLTKYGSIENALSLWSEVRWWRDHQYQLPWIPPYFPGNGRRWKTINQRINPQAYQIDQNQQPIQGSQAVRLLDPDIIDQINGFTLDFGEYPQNSLVDWSYLDAIENDSITMSDFPEWAQYLIKDIDDPVEEDRFVQYLLRLLSNPTNNTNHKDLNNYF